MTFTATFPIGYYPGSPRELFIEDAPLVVEFEADVRVERDPVEVDWPPVVVRGVSIDCDASSVDIESAMLGVECWMCEGKGWWYSLIRRYTGDRFTCTKCVEGIRQSNVLPTLTEDTLAQLRDTCAEYAAKGE